MKIFEDKYIVITGGAGFIGSCLIKHLNDENIKNIIIFDNLGCGEKWKNLVGKRFLDLLHKDFIFDWLVGREGDISTFIHLGACCSTVEKDAGYLLENNYQYSVRLAEYALTHEHRFIYASSAATYGDGSLGFFDEHDLLPQLRPLNIYGYSKHLFDMWLYEQHLLDRVAGLKFFNVYGPNEYHKGRMASALPKMVKDASQTGMIHLFHSSDPARFRDGEQLRDFFYIKDAVRMIASFLTNDLCGIYNIGTGKPHSWNQLARAVAAALGMPIKIEYIPLPEDLLGKYQNYTCADMSKAAKASLLIPKYSLEEAVNDYVRNYLIAGAYW